MAKSLPNYRPNNTTVIAMGSNGFNLLVTIDDESIVHTYQSYDTPLLQLCYVAGEQQDYSTSGYGCYVQLIDTKTYTPATSRHQKVLASMFPGLYYQDRIHKAVEGVDFDKREFGEAYRVQ